MSRRSDCLSSTPVEIASVSWRQLQLEPGAELGCVEIVLLLFRQPHAAFRHGLLVDVQRPKLTRRGAGARCGQENGESGEAKHGVTHENRTVPLLAFPVLTSLPLPYELA